MNTKHKENQLRGSFGMNDRKILQAICFQKFAYMNY
jgi:hypothetical protein